jgi:predicted NAD-dependent protein-ADP-ribosyltransferase YbiA (DUF1768 family)
MVQNITMATIKEFQGEYRWLSNFAQCSITLGDSTYPSVEHAYMSAKSEEESWKAKCSSGKFSAGEIKTMSRGVKLIEGWGDKKLAIMEGCVRQKYNQEPYKAKLLAIPKDTEIQEGNRWKDTFWGMDILTSKGENHLGILIMRVKKELEAEVEAKKKEDQCE